MHKTGFSYNCEIKYSHTPSIVKRAVTFIHDTTQWLQTSGIESYKNLFISLEITVAYSMAVKYYCGIQDDTTWQFFNKGFFKLD